jgi:deoxyhypusine synthase
MTDRKDPLQGHGNFREFADAESEGLEPLRPLDLTSVRDFDEMLRAMRDTAFGGRSLGEAADVLYEMATDPDCFVVATFSGAMTVAKQGLLICEMIDRGLVNAVISTGALMAHGLVEGAGMAHFKHRPDMDDRTLYHKGYDRVYDTLELEKNLDDIEEIFRHVLDKWPVDEPTCSHKLAWAIGRYLDENTEGRAILKSAAHRGVPVYIPAFTDSVLGLDFGTFNRGRREDGETPLRYDPFLDLDDYCERILDAKRLGIFTIGGGVPRNWAQQVGPYIDYIHKRAKHAGYLQRFHYAVRICPEPVHWGGLSGCTYSEGVSWGKFVPASEGGKFAEVYADATIAWPILLAGVLQRMDKRK